MKTPEPGALIKVRVTPELAARIDEFRRQLPYPPARDVAARMLIEYALDGRGKPPRKERAAVT